MWIYVVKQTNKKWTRSEEKKKKKIYNSTKIIIWAIKLNRMSRKMHSNGFVDRCAVS